VGNTETMKGMGRAGRVNVKRKEVEIARAINQALLRRHTGVLRKSKNQDETFLTEPTSLEMFPKSVRKYSGLNFAVNRLAYASSGLTEGVIRIPSSSALRRPLEQRIELLGPFLVAKVET